MIMHIFNIPKKRECREGVIHEITHEIIILIKQGIKIMHVIWNYILAIDSRMVHRRVVVQLVSNSLVVVVVGTMSVQEDRVAALGVDS
eukprot:m.3768 g.3768  ORF g.3768 m.3768 type:complete len:88 (-) comp2122_c0_seq1:465-728(-)